MGNFEFLSVHSKALASLGATAEKIFPLNPASCVFKLRLLAEAITQDVAARLGIQMQQPTHSRSLIEYWGSEIPWVSSGEVRSNQIQKTNECISQLGFDYSSVRILPTGVVLIAMIGEGKTRGQSALLAIEATINQNVAAVVPIADVLDSKYLWFCFQCQYENNRRAGNWKGPQALNCQKVRELPLNLPPLEEQTEIVRRVETLFAFADRLESRLQTAANRLTPALLAKAFRGELVPQDPSDESATELLRRLRESRATATPIKRKAALGGNFKGHKTVTSAKPRGWFTGIERAWA